MNSYGHIAMRHWRQHAPGRVAAMADPIGFFTELGDQAQAQIADLACLLAGTDPIRETYPQKVSRLRSARRTAEEVVMTQLVWIQAPELPLGEAREEWDQTRASDEGLIMWAERVQDCPDLMPSSDELEQMAKTWAVSPEFLLDLVAAEIPRRFLAEHQGTMAEAASIRFLREVR